MTSYAQAQAILSPVVARERPILFSAPMVRALLSGRKTQTRRVYKPLYPAPYEIIDETPAGEAWPFRSDEYGDYHFQASPYGVVGDRLWVRETFVAGTFNGGERRWVRYAATDFDLPAGTKFRPSIFLPRWASRISLDVTAVRFQRLQEISEEDAKAEGPLFAMDEEQTVLNPELTDARNNGCGACRGERNGIAELCHDDLRGKGRPFACWYATLWDAINGTRAPWKSNPWVWAISFPKVSK